MPLVETRPSGYLDEVAALNEDLAGKPVIVNSLNFHISKKATQELYGSFRLLA